MTSTAARLKPTPDLCIVDNHPAEHDCRRVRVDFYVEVRNGQWTSSTQALEMCGAGIKLQGPVPAKPGDNVQLRIFFPGRRIPLEGKGTVRSNGGETFQCEYWALNSYEQEFIDSFVTACRRRQELRQTGCEHQ